MQTIKEQKSNQKYNGKMAKAERHEVVAERAEPIRNAGPVEDETPVDVAKAMSTGKPAKKPTLDLDAVDKILKKAIRDGRATRQLFSMKALGELDMRYQCRVEHYNNPHVEMIRGWIRDEKEIDPIIVVRCRKTGDTKVPDGFHRHEAHRLEKKEAILAWVIESEDFEHESLMIAAVANRKVCLPKSQDDIRKTIITVIKDERCNGWSDNRIAVMCGVGPEVVTRIRLELKRSDDVPLPATVTMSDGRVRVYRNAASLKKRTKRANVWHESITSMAKWFSARGIFLEAAITPSEANRYPGLSGLYGHGCVIVRLDFSVTVLTQPAQGQLRQLREKLGLPSARMIAACDPKEGPASTMDFARQDGIEFLTPEELVASIKGDTTNGDRS
jgi:hypothetical protein